MESITLCQAFNRRNLLARMHDCQRQAGIDALSINQHRAGTALSVITAFLCAVHANVFSQCVEQRDARLQSQFVRLAVNTERHRYC